MHLVQILLPCADNNGQLFESAEYDRVKEDLASSFDGVTAYLRAPAEGLWREGAEASHDEIVIFEVMTEEIDLTDWRRRRVALERRFHQDKVIIRYMPIGVI
ncbi:hypothetical protein N8E89_24425 (plasmid) [Phyllobacterium sp. A18/5-2]|uniref:hypothetical protein n=1 Tax=Phyllobacterium sp. A18/5-2 TaxID=2978392 RepID=UPI0021C9C708|nr:hypothetical protein [Phyllobacterium sp. A18/5-2]UXN66314.1 hypothetical protein N8E89_24425 [Phyllobacterium sp. A18/5-2]